MAWGAITVGAVALAVVVVGIAAFALPLERTATVTISFDATPEEVFAVYTDPASQPRWRKGVASVAMLSETFPRIWTETPKRGPASRFEEIEVVPNQRYVLRLFAEGSFEGEYTATFEPDGEEGTRGTFTEQVTTAGPIATLFSHLFVNLEHEIETYAAEAKSEIERRR